MTKRPAALLQLEPSDAIEYFLLFTLRMLEGREPLPKAAAAEFWVSLPLAFVIYDNELTDIGQFCWSKECQ